MSRKPELRGARPWPRFGEKVGAGLGAELRRPKSAGSSGSAQSADGREQQHHPAVQEQHHHPAVQDWLRRG